MSNKEKLETLYIEMKNSLTEQMVFGDGNPDTGILLIGEAPGGDEIRIGRPFVGKAGKNLDSFMESIDMSRDTCYITNAVKFRPTKVSDKGNTINATPTWDDILKFRPYLKREIEIISPKIIVTLGGVPAKSITGTDKFFMSSSHGRLIHSDEFNCEVFHLYHPAAVIYNQNLVETYNQDLKVLKKILNSLN